MESVWFEKKTPAHAPLLPARPQRTTAWYLLTNEKVETDEPAWKLVQAYAHRGQIQQSFRFPNSALVMESCRLWFRENKMKRLPIVALVDAFLLTLLEQKPGKRSKACCDRLAIEPESGAGTLLPRFSKATEILLSLSFINVK